MFNDQQGRELESPWIFNKGEPTPDPGKLMIPVTVPGRALDLSYGGIGTPLVHARVAALFAELAPEDVQLFPVEIEGQSEPFFILVATRLIRCIDERASRHARRWSPEDGRPEKVGTYRDVRGMRIDPSQVGDAKVFRPWGWSIALVVREELKTALERIGASGAEFEEV